MHSNILYYDILLCWSTYTKRAKLQCVMEDSEEEWEGILDKGDWPEGSGETRETEEVREEDEGVRASSVSEAKSQEKTEEEKQKESRNARREARRMERKARRSERLEQMKDLIYLVGELGSKVDRFAEEVRVSNVLRNRADREYLQERRRWDFPDRMANARDWNED
jgi:hypothetical protein